MKPCTVCGKTAPPEDMGTFGDEAPETRYPCCRTCHEDGSHEKWRSRAIDALQSSPVAFESKGNLANDYAELLSWQRHTSRIEDGVCPNGCATMVFSDPSNAECPKCHFQYHHRTLSA